MVRGGGGSGMGRQRVLSGKTLANSPIKTQEIRAYCKLSSDAEQFLERAAQQQGLCAAALPYLEDSMHDSGLSRGKDVVVRHTADAIHSRTLDRSYW
jgi:magnesium chelatase family protein